jgi:polysaccharide pyruvyl transferase CsaB
VFGVKAVDRWRPLSVLFELIGCNLFISGGGSLLQDVTSPRSPRYYLWVIRFANLLAKKTIIFCQGIGPLNLEKNRKMTANVLKNCSEIIVRDPQSAQLLAELGLGNNIQVACDPVMALSNEDIDREEIRELLQDVGILDSRGRKLKPMLLVVLRPWKDNTHLVPIAQLLDAQARIGWDVVLAPAHFPDDMEVIDKISNLMHERLYCVGKCMTANQYLALTAYADKVFSMRLHGLIFAMAMGAPMLALSYDPKVDAFMEQAGLARYCMAFEEFDWETADYLLDEMEASPLRDRLAQEERRREMHRMAWEAAKKAADLLGSTS